MDSETAKSWCIGERCRVTFAGRTVDATVHIVSEGRPMAVSFEAILGRCAGMALLLWEGERSVEVFSGQPIELTEPGPEDGDG